MHTIPASEIKRRGVAALDEALKSGPVHIIKNNRPRYVVLSEEDYQALTKRTTAPTRSAPGLMPEKPAAAITQEKIDPGSQGGSDSFSIPATVRLGVAAGRYPIPAPDPAEDARVAALFEASEVFPPADEA